MLLENSENEEAFIIYLFEWEPGLTELNSNFLPKWDTPLSMAKVKALAEFMQQRHLLTSLHILITNSSLYAEQLQISDDRFVIALIFKLYVRMTSNSRFKIIRVHSGFLILLTRSDKAYNNYYFEVESAVDKNHDFPTIVLLLLSFLNYMSERVSPSCLHLS